MKKTICLNMIVKNESQVIARCLASVKPIISYWVIVDTGSTDGTQEVIRDFLKDVPGELYERAWVNFCHNRNEALELAKGKADYLFIIDADDVLLLSDDFVMPELDKDYYHIPSKGQGITTYKDLLVNNHLDWQWETELHEYIKIVPGRTKGHIAGFSVGYNLFKDGMRTKDPEKFHKDAKTFEELIKKEPTNARYQFFLAHSLRLANAHEKAYEQYQKRLQMGGSIHERFYSFLQLGLLSEILKKPIETCAKMYQEAYLLMPTRAEPLYYMARMYRLANDIIRAYTCAQRGVQIPEPTDGLYIASWIYEWGLLGELEIAASKLGNLSEAMLACQKMLTVKTLPADVRATALERIEQLKSRIAGK